jgi:hypothetical protein
MEKVNSDDNSGMLEVLGVQTQLQQFSVLYRLSFVLPDMYPRNDIIFRASKLREEQQDVKKSVPKCCQTQITAIFILFSI